MSRNNNNNNNKMNNLDKKIFRPWIKFGKQSLQ